jgi:hypothetical protein
VVDEGAGASSSERSELGAAAAALVRRDGESMLLTSVGTVTLDLDLAAQPTPMPPADLLLDLARRILSRLARGQQKPAGGGAP